MLRVVEGCGFSHRAPAGSARCSSCASRSSSSSNSRRVTRPRSFAIFSMLTPARSRTRTASPRHRLASSSSLARTLVPEYCRSQRARPCGRVRRRCCRRWRRSSAFSRSAAGAVGTSSGSGSRPRPRGSTASSSARLGSGSPSPDPPSPPVLDGDRAAPRVLGLALLQHGQERRATKKVEKAPSPIPMNSANAKSFSVAPPKISRATTGSSVMKLVASERRIVSQSETFAIAANGRAASAGCSRALGRRR